MNTNMTGFRWFSKNLCVLVLWAKVISALEGLSGLSLRLSVSSRVYQELNERFPMTYDSGGQG